MKQIKIQLEIISFPQTPVVSYVVYASFVLVFAN